MKELKTIKKELKTIYDNAKSFYKKAFTIEEGDEIRLVSYTTTMATYNFKNNKLILNNNTWNYTTTTLRHIKEFLKQFTNINATTKKDILKLI